MVVREPVRIGALILTAEEVQARKDKLGIHPEDEERLREAHPYLVPHIRETIGRFYHHLLSNEHTREILLSAPGLLERLNAAQTQYFLELTSGKFDLDYFENRVRIGRAHRQAGLTPEWYLGAYGKYLKIVTEALRVAFGKDEERFFRTLKSLRKVISLDMTLAIDASNFCGWEDPERKADALERVYAEMQKDLTDKERLIRTILHDLQNPLAGVVGFLQALEDEREGITQLERDSLREALARCDDVSQLIQNVIQLGRAESGALHVRLQDVDLARVAHACVEALRHVAEHSGRELFFTGSAQQVVVRTDPTLLRRMLDNLIRNALRHTPATTRVEVNVRAAPRAQVLICEDGPGLPRALRDGISRAALRRAWLPLDSGIGLAFCRMACDLLGVALRLETEPGHGSRSVLEYRSDREPATVIHAMDNRTALHPSGAMPSGNGSA